MFDLDLDFLLTDPGAMGWLGHESCHGLGWPAVVAVIPRVECQAAGSGLRVPVKSRLSSVRHES